jgi:hypothetical protein
LYVAAGLNSVSCLGCQDGGVHVTNLEQWSSVATGLE